MGQAKQTFIQWALVEAHGERTEGHSAGLEGQV